MTIQEVVTQAAVHQPTHSHATIAVWALVVIVLAQLVVIWLLLKARGGWDFIHDIPMTNLRSLAAIGLFAATIIGTGLIGYFAGVWPPEYIYDSTLVAETLWAGLEIGAVWMKRRTTDPTIASKQNVQAGISQTTEMQTPVG